MKKLPEDLKILKRIAEKLDLLMKDPHTPVEIRSNDLYDYAIKDKLISSNFFNQRDFNRFLRKQHNKGYLKQIIPNCRVDDTNKEFYQWHFRKKSKPKNNGRNFSGVNGNYIHFRKNLNIQTSDNTFVRSEQEKLIYESLIKNEELNVIYDYPLIHRGKRKNVDFFIENKKDNTEYFWEHFGMTNNEDYLSKIPKTINWYKDAGFKNIEEKNGNLIFTYYKDIGVFQREVDKNISKILKSNLPFKTREIQTSEMPVVDIYVAIKFDFSSGKGSYALLLKHERDNLKHQKNFIKSFYLASKEKIILSAISGGLSKLRKIAVVNVYLNSNKLIRILNQEETTNENPELIERIIDYSKTHQLSFRKIINPMNNRDYLDTEELLSIE